jgi:hypothetical protein
VGTESTGCLTTYDVSDPANPKRITSIAGAGQHTTACLLDCTWLYGSTGAITDNRIPAKAHVVGNWQDGLPDLYTDPKTGKKKKFGATCHHLREIQPGLILGSCQPFIVMSIRPEEGGSVMKPVILDIGTNTDNRFIHSSRWPNQGRDKFVLVGGETNFHPSCDDTSGAFMVWDAGAVIDGNGGFKRGQTFHELSELRPQSGNYVDGRSPNNALGCSVHWFEEHPSFNNGGLVALAEYENGTHFLQITASGKIIDKDWFLPLGGSTSAPHWNPYDPTIVYSIDYARGVDVLKYTGPTYVPPSEPPAPPAAAASAAAPCAEGAGFDAVAAKRSGRGVRLSAALREGKTFDLTLYQVSHGRSLTNRRVARYTGKKGAVSFGAARGLTDGRYVARFVTKTAKGRSDVRLLALRRQGGRWVTTQPFALPPCGLFTSFALSGPAFGGARSRPLTISYALRRGADAVRIEAFIGKKVIKRFTGGGTARKTYRFKLPARGIRRGALVRVRATVSQGSPVPPATVYARRI